ncbi:hypothetical protein LCM23_25190 [Cytobacillus kochii]|uniref:hypothetical protein n=1 Tax=Cytobacillus kochii TaxID=859143 RepID=UPI001CD230CC|nr:hypothetical protein [Cytobacillus kochii]MCA1029311.1 hypothetical protein [Cytobacillus kochii]
MRIRWNDELIKSELKKCISYLQIDRMPTASELITLGRNDLHCKISKTKKYSGWAKEIGLEMKSSETTKGNTYEFYILEKIKEISSGFSVKKMSTKHPYDLLVNDCVKVDVKVCKAHNHFGSRAHTFGINKKYATCDIYVCIALDEHDIVENYFIIPAARLQLTTLNIGTDSKYNMYKNRWDILCNFVRYYEKALVI